MSTCDKHGLPALPSVCIVLPVWRYQIVNSFVQPCKGYLDAPVIVWVGVQVHYNSVYPQGEAPVQPSKSKVLGSKKLGRFIHAFAV